MAHVPAPGDGGRSVRKGEHCLQHPSGGVRRGVVQPVWQWRQAVELIDGFGEAVDEHGWSPSLDEGWLFRLGQVVELWRSRRISPYAVSSWRVRSVFSPRS